MTVHASLPRRHRDLVAALLFLAVSAASQAGTLYLARLSGANENPPTGAAYSGTGVLILNDAENQATITATHNISIPVTGGHIHRGTATVNGPVIFPFPAPTSPVGPLTWAIPTADVDNLKNGGLYMNFHTGVNPGGAIRSTLVRALLGPAAMTPAQQRLANALDLSAGYDSDLDQILVATNLADAATQTATLGDLTAGTIYVQGRGQLENMANLSDGLFAYLDDARANPAPASSTLGGFVRLGGEFGKRAASWNQAASSYSRPYVVAGLDRQFGPSTRLGLAVGYANGRDTFEGGRGKTTTKTTALQGFLSFGLGDSGVVVDGSAALGSGRIDSTRNLASLGRTAKGSPDGSAWSAALRASKPFALAEGAKLVPYALFDVAKATVDGYAETGAGAADLVVRKRAQWNSALEAGASLDFAAHAGERPMFFRLQAGWRHLLEDGAGSTGTWLAGSPIGFTTAFDGARQNTFRVEASANTALSERTLASLAYRGLLGGETVSAVEARLTFRF